MVLRYMPSPLVRNNTTVLRFIQRPTYNNNYHGVTPYSKSVLLKITR